jgi:phage tail sheath protein FI
MFKGIIVQHGHRQPRNKALVRCDITAFIGFVFPDQWPEGYERGDFIEIVVRGEREFISYPLRSLFGSETNRAIRNFFMNGGDTAHVFVICVSSKDDITSAMMLEEAIEQVLYRLRAEEDISLINVPLAAYLPVQMFQNGDIFCGCEAIYTLLLRHCSEMNNRFLIMDTSEDLHEELLLRWMKQFRQRNIKNGQYGAIYYPWLCEGEDIFPPGSCVAGIFVEVERQHPPIGIHWPPANIPFKGVTHPLVALENNEVSYLSQENINPIYTQANRGIMPMGARTLSNDQIFQQVNSRRIMNMVVEQLRRDSQWAVFEVNNPHLWSVLSRDVRYRLEEFWNAGLLTLSNDGSKYEVRCNAENNPPELLDAGYINIEVRFQPVGTTEQILVDLNIGAS